jgi:thiol-disulfide isomerase/thioredoxin
VSSGATANCRIEERGGGRTTESENEAGGELQSRATVEHDTDCHTGATFLAPREEGMSDTDASDTATPTTDDRPVHLADAAELDALLADDDLVLVECYTEGCGICASMEPVLGNVARVTDATVALVNPRDDPQLVDRFTVQSVPTLLLFVEGELVARLADGFQGADAVVEFIESNR